MSLFQILATVCRSLLAELGCERPLQVNPDWQELQARLCTSRSVVDLGCGANPHPRAAVAVDAFLQPLHRSLGYGEQISPAAFRERGVSFAQADLTALPFADKVFDFAYAHHVLEHVPDPKKACAEMCRVAQAGAVITPAVFAEVAFDRPYHLWFVLARENTLLFIEKESWDYCPFGSNPIKAGKHYSVTSKTNPFDILLNDGGWYHGKERMPRLSRLLRHYWYSHSPVVEVVFVWDDSFDCVVVRKDGSVD